MVPINFSLPLVSLIAVIYFGLVNGRTSVKYINGKLLKTDTFDVDKALERALKLVQQLQAASGVDLPHTNWYQRIDYAKQPRFAEMGRLIIADIQDTAPGKFSSGSCTAFYVGRDLLATAAHCLTTALDITSGKHFLFFHHRYDAQADFPVRAKIVQMRKKMLVGVEWWFPAEFPSRYKVDRIAADGLDYAFVRVNKPKEQPDAFYTLKEPDEVLRQNIPLVVAGYPADVIINNDGQKPNTFMPVYVTARPHLPDSPEVTGFLRSYAKALEGLAKQYGKPVEAKTPSGQSKPKPDYVAEMAKPIVKDHQIVAMADDVCASGGASGGPWLLRAATVAKEKLEVYGIVATGRERILTKDPDVEMFEWENKYLKPMTSTRITAEIIVIQDHLRANKEGKGFITS